MSSLKNKACFNKLKTPSKRCAERTHAPNSTPLFKNGLGRISISCYANLLLHPLRIDSANPDNTSGHLIKKKKIASLANHKRPCPYYKC